MGIDDVEEDQVDELIFIETVESIFSNFGVLIQSGTHEISEDKEITTVFECLGGDALPYQAISACLKAGKNVISSNKETISCHLKEYSELCERYHAHDCVIEPFARNIVGIRKAFQIAVVRIEVGMNFQGNPGELAIASSLAIFEDALHCAFLVTTNQIQAVGLLQEGLPVFFGIGSFEKKSKAFFVTCPVFYG